MAGQVIANGKGVWTVRVFQGRDAAGKRKYVNRTVRGSKKDAQLVLNQMLVEKDLGTLVRPTRRSFGQHAEEWMETVVKGRVRNRTQIDYQSILDRYLLPTFRATPVSQIAPEDIQRHYSELQAKGLSAQTIRHIHAVLRNALHQAVRWRIAAGNPCDLVDLPQARKPEMKALSTAQANAFLSAAAQFANHEFFTLLLTTGMRPGEALALRWCDVDLNSGAIAITRALSGRGKDYRFEEPKTPMSRRRVPLPKSVTELLAAKKERRQKSAGEDLIELELVFQTESGKPLDLANLNKRFFKPILKAAKLPADVRIYDLRHTCATMLLEAGTNPKIVSERLGHASTTLTLDTYSHVLPDMQRAATDQIEAMLFSKKSSDRANTLRP